MGTGSRQGAPGAAQPPSGRALGGRSSRAPGGRSATAAPSPRAVAAGATAGNRSLVVRTWNLFHGRTLPETGRVHLERMVRLVAEGAPTAVCLQEVPLWGLSRLESWSGMRSLAIVTKRALAGPLGGPLQRLDSRVMRSAVTGQANALLLRRDLELVGAAAQRLNPRSGGERRACQVVTVQAEGKLLLLANTHLSLDRRHALAELERVGGLVARDLPAIVAGDLNLRETGLPGFSPPIDGIDQVLARGLRLTRPPAPWSDERRRADHAVLLSDHAPVEAEIMWP